MFSDDYNFGVSADTQLCYPLRLYRRSHGQYGYSGHVINLPVAAFMYTLPHLSSYLDVIVVKKEVASQSHRDFHVRRSRVLSALECSHY